MSTVTSRFSPAEAQALGRIEQRLRDLGRDVAPEGGADEVALAQPFEHAVEGAGELADLVARLHGQRLGEVAVGDAAHARGEGADGAGQAAAPRATPRTSAASAPAMEARTIAVRSSSRRSR